MTLALCLGSREEVDAVTEQARAAGARIKREPGETFWVTEITEATHDRTEDPRRGPRAAGPRHSAVGSSHTSELGAPITSRTSIGCLIGTPSGPGAAEILAAISIARAGDSTSTIR